MSCELSVAAVPEEGDCPQWVAQPDVAARARLLGERFKRAYGRPPVGVWAAP
ncbi:galactokinase, partial [Kocuria sp. HSID17582]